MVEGGFSCALDLVKYIRCAQCSSRGAGFSIAMAGLDVSCLEGKTCVLRSESQGNMGGNSQNT